MCVLDTLPSVADVGENFDIVLAAEQSSFQFQFGNSRLSENAWVAFLSKLYVMNNISNTGQNLFLDVWQKVIVLCRIICLNFFKKMF